MFLCLFLVKLSERKATREVHLSFLLALDVNVRNHDKAECAETWYVT